VGLNGHRLSDWISEGEMDPHSYRPLAEPTAKVFADLMATSRPPAGGDHVPDGRPSGSELVQVHDLRPPEIPRQRGGDADDEPSYPHEPANLVLLAQDRPDQALELLERLRALAIARAGMGDLIEIQALRALAAGGEHIAAVAALAKAITLAYPQGYLLVFADEDASMTVLLGRLNATQRTEQTAARGVPTDYPAPLLPAFDTTHAVPHPGKGAAAAMPGLIEPLTARELEVLALLAAGRSNRRIAAELYVTLDTVKKHVGHILDKLGAANRTEAAARARQLGLIG
jgi:LuxR family transcriptional regulator, maltose regulon positive regulatory protein